MDESQPQPPAATPHDRSGPGPLVIGILGGIASGKSAVAARLAGPRGMVLAADAIAHEVLRSPEVTALVADRFGERAIGPDGTPDRAQLAAIVFDPAEGKAARETLEGWTHPRVRARILARLDEARTQKLPRVVLDVPLLLENDAQHGLVARCDVLVFVDSDPAERDARAVSTRGWEPGEVARRESLQLPLSEKRQRAHHIVENKGSLDELTHAIERLDAELRKRSNETP